MDINQAIETKVREVVAEIIGPETLDPVPLSVKQVLEQYECFNESMLRDLIREAPANGFPVVRLSPRTTLIEKRRLNAWLASGGLGVKA